jgi:transposase InsO family protein
MGLGRGTYYYRLRQQSLMAKKEEADLRDRIEQIVVERARYGYRRVTYQLRREGYKVNHKRVSRMMREQSLQCQVKRRWVKTTDSDHSHRIYPNLIKELKVRGRNQVWVGDITYIRILTGFLYLAVVLDLFSRKVIGWALSEQIDAQLTLAALRMALEERGSVEGCIHHSDRGVQYACHAYVEELQAAKMRISMARKGNPYDNAAAESFMKTLKYEEVYLWDYHSVEDVKHRIPYFLQEVYNQKRLHSALGYVTPEEFEQAELASLALNQGTGMSTPGEIVGYRANGEAVYSVIYDKKCLDRKTT